VDAHATCVRKSCGRLHPLRVTPVQLPAPQNPAHTTGHSADAPRSAWHTGSPPSHLRVRDVLDLAEFLSARMKAIRDSISHAGLCLTDLGRPLFMPRLRPKRSAQAGGQAGRYGWLICRAGLPRQPCPIPMAIQRAIAAHHAFIIRMYSSCDPIQGQMTVSPISSPSAP